MMTQTTADSATCRLRWISGRASTTIVVSTAVISTPAMITIMRETGPRRSALRGRSGVVGGPDDPRESHFLSLTNGGFCARRD